MKIIFFDGTCAVCNGFVNFLFRQDTRENLYFAPLQGSTAKAKLSNYPIHDTIIYYDGTNVFDLSTGAILSVAALEGCWTLVKACLWFPKNIRDAVYMLFAKNRYRLTKNNKCLIRPVAAQRRFLV